MIFKIVDRKISVESEVVLSYSLDYVATFEFDEEWNNKIVTARFVHENGNMVEVVLDSENSCNIPLFPKGIVNVGVYTDEFTSTYAPMRIYTSIKDIGEHEVIPPTADVYQQIISLIEEGRIKGEDGFSPTVVIEDIEGGHTVVITDAEGDKEFDVMDGSDYIITESDYQAIADRVPQPDLSEYVKNTDYAYSSKGGVFKAGNGIAVNQSNGTIYAVTKSVSEYKNEPSAMAISKGTLENVLAERMKEPQFELIEEITLTEDVASITRNAETNGTPYNFKELRFTIYIPQMPTSGNMNLFIETLANGTTLAQATASLGSTSYGVYALCELSVTNGIFTAMVTEQSQWLGGCYGAKKLNNIILTQKNIGGLKLSRPTGMVLPSGTNIKIYAVRG